ncbi:ABC transporter permease [Roseibacillus ishigakijimensis]|uniref:ABC transporter permease n=1 Tax=Roseibacillus ishigakijimensis TaxID=454146 RepID=A0A934RS89_9BACT|nr:ABC transporter permease [Roseibacillus ishigakijimensis]
MGDLFLAFCRYLGELAFLVGEVAESLWRGRLRWPQFYRQIAEIGFRSQPVVVITGAFTGAVLAAQALFQFKLVGMETLAGGLVSAAMLRELGPVITGLMLAGRVGSSMAAEIGTMRVTEQIDALRSMAVHPIDYLVTPRFLAMFVSIPLLLVQSVVCGILASYLIGVPLFHVEEADWWKNVRQYSSLADVSVALIKGGAFGLLIVIISCHQGLQASNGAVGVGKGTTRAMVYSSLAILVANFLLSMLMQLIFPLGIVTS